jgi:phospholipid/cholesterol/gamma-HCH transport system permease protein
MRTTLSAIPDATLPRNAPQRALAALGRFSRAQVQFSLAVLALSSGVFSELPLPSSWRRTVRAEFGRVLRRAVTGGMTTILVAAALIGLAIVYGTLFWLKEADQDRLIGSILVTVLLRQVAPVIVGLILLGRSGIVVTAEIGTLQLNGGVRLLAAQGIDPFLFLVLPPAAALAVASYTLGTLFVMAALTIGFIAGNLLGGVTMSVWAFFEVILQGMQPSDFVTFPAKMLIIGLLIALVAVLTGLSGLPGDDVSTLLPRAFVRGTLAILLTSVVLGLGV